MTKTLSKLLATFVSTTFMACLATAAHSNSTSLFEELYVKGGEYRLSKGALVVSRLEGSSSKPAIMLRIKKNSVTNKTGKDIVVLFGAKYTTRKDTECFVAKIPKKQFQGNAAYWNVGVLKVCAKTEDGKRYRWVELKARKDQEVRFSSY